MLATLTISGSGAASTQTACGRRARTMRSATIRCSRRSLSLRSSCSPRWSSTAGAELRRGGAGGVRDGGVGASAGRAGEGDGGDAGAGAPDQQLGAGPDEGGLRGAAAEAEAGGELLAHGAEDRSGIMGGGGGDDDLAGEHDLGELAGGDPGCGALDRGFELAWRPGAADLGVGRGVR